MVRPRLEQMMPGSYLQKGGKDEYNERARTRGGHKIHKEKKRTYTSHSRCFLFCFLAGDEVMVCSIVCFV